MQVPILNGIYTDTVGDFRTSYPRNLIPVPKEQGISNGYLRPADGIVKNGEGPGYGRGGINWNGVCYRAMGTKLVSINPAGTVTVLGEIGGTDLVRFDYSFDRLAIASNGNLFYWDGVTLQQVTDPDLGLVIDMLFVDGYFMTTDGENLVVTDLNDPFSVNPLKYGSSEVDPDPVKGLLKLRDEVYAMNRYTVELFDNKGGDNFPFNRIKGAMLTRGSIGTRTCAVFQEAIAFLGSGRNESPAVWLGLNSQLVKISTREIDTILEGYAESELALCLVETKVDKSHQWLIVHLPDKTLVYDGAATLIAKEPVWFTLDSGLEESSKYKGRDLVWCYNRWLVNDQESVSIGYYDNSISSHYGERIGWDFGTTILYNQGNGAIINEMELVCLTGHVVSDVDPTIWTSYSNDGETWSVEKPKKSGKQGNRAKRIVWIQQGSVGHWRIQRFRGTSDSFLSIARLEMKIEPLYVGH